MGGVVGDDGVHAAHGPGDVPWLEHVVGPGAKGK